MLLFRFAIVGFASLFLTLVVIYVYVFRKSFLLNRGRNRVFECGFKPRSSSRLPFSIQFVFLIILFIIFDIEILFFVGLPLYLYLSLFYSWFLVIFLLFLLLIGLMEE